MVTLQPIGALERATGLKKTTIYDGVRAGLIPPPVRYSATCSRWTDYEIDAVARAIAAGATAEQRRKLAQDLLAQRRALMPAGALS